MAERLQRSRKKGARLPPGTVCVDRSTKWGNPYRGGDKHPLRTSPIDRAQAVKFFAADLLLFGSSLGYTKADVRRELAGKNLACYCPLPAEGEVDHCHAAILIEVANS